MAIVLLESESPVGPTICHLPIDHGRRGAPFSSLSLLLLFPTLHPTMTDRSNRSSLSPGYAIGILLSVPAGLLLAMRFGEGLSTGSFIAVAMIPAVIVCLAAWIETRRRNR